ncbi:MAG: heparan-alpha-glucosaminide N-acetyltransferase domain-containing protein [Polyangiaceae bacterium]
MMPTVQSHSTASRASVSSQRLVALDALRGATIAAMILVNNPGSWSAVYPPLLHAHWHGCTFTDLIFPAFLFMVGVSLQFSKKTTARAALRRTAILFALGLLLATFPFFPVTRFTNVRIPGVLQRIALAYLAAWLLERRLNSRHVAYVIAAILVGYWALLALVPLPDGTPANLEPGTNLSAFVDRALLGKHVWSQTKTWDPEGVLSTLPAIATTLLGCLAGRWIRTAPHERRAPGLVVAGAGLALAGWVASFAFPLNKNLWTSSYVLFTGGLVAVALGALYAITEVYALRRWAQPLVIYGENGIVVFVGSGLVGKALVVFKIGTRPVQAVLFKSAFGWIEPAKVASLTYAIVFVGLFYGVAALLHARRVLIKI